MLVGCIRQPNSSDINTTPTPRPWTSKQGSIVNFATLESRSCIWCAGVSETTLTCKHHPTLMVLHALTCAGCVWLLCTIVHAHPYFDAHAELALVIYVLSNFCQDGLQVIRSCSTSLHLSSHALFP